MLNSRWQPHSWQAKKHYQPVNYASQATLNKTLKTLSGLPPLVMPLEINALKSELAKAAIGKQFLLQGGDCAESFADCDANKTTNKLRILLQMSLVLRHGLHKPVICVGRMAGQYAKPRSSETETVNNITLPNYRGDLINGIAFTKIARTPNPNRLLQGYHHAALTLNYIRALMNGSLDLTQSVRHTSEIKQTSFYTSHEALHLYYEEMLTRQHNDTKWYNLSTHFPWIGMRTNALDGAHIEYIRGINNPIAVKIGPKNSPEEIAELVDLLNPLNEPGRLTLIHRFGVQHINDKLPALINAVKATKKIVLWSCDPMHGNTLITHEGYKTRMFNDILSELKQAFQIHAACDTYLGGVHFELTAEHVKECVGGSTGIRETDLRYAYKSLVDPRLNYEQALEMAMLITQADIKHHPATFDAATPPCRLFS